jgi:hypothetical protein
MSDQLSDRHLGSDHPAVHFHTSASGIPASRSLLVHLIGRRSPGDRIRPQPDHNVGLPPRPSDTAQHPSSRSSRRQPPRRCARSRQRTLALRARPLSRRQTLPPCTTPRTIRGCSSVGFGHRVRRLPSRRCGRYGSWRRCGCGSITSRASTIRLDAIGVVLIPCANHRLSATHVLAVS